MSYHVAAAAQNAILDGGLPALITLGGGSLRVALFLDGVECSGNGYARQTVSTASAAASGQKDLATVTFTASGGSIVYNQAKVYAADGTTLYLTSGISSDNTIGAEAHVMTLSLRTLDNNPIYCANPTELQAALSAQQTSRQKVAAAGIEHAFTSTLVADAGVGGWLEGLGSHEPSNAFYDALSTVFYWAGARGGTESLMRYERARMILRHIMFQGATQAEITAGVVEKAYCGLFMKRAITPYAGAGTGKIIGDDLMFSWFKKAIILGGGLAEHNNDLCSWNDLFFDRNDCAVEMVGQQVLGHHFLRPHFGDNTIGFNVISGGDVSITNGTMEGRGNTLFNFPTGSENNFGGNNNSYSIQGLKIDAQATTAKILSMANPAQGYGYYSNLHFDRLHFPEPILANGAECPFWGGAAIAPAFVASGNAVVTITNPINLQRGMLGHDTAGSGLTKYRIIGARVYYRAADPITQVQDLIRPAGNVGLAHYTFEGCYNYTSGSYYADWSGTA